MRCAGSDPHKITRANKRAVDNFKPGSCGPRDSTRKSQSGSPRCTREARRVQMQMDRLELGERRQPPFESAGSRLGAAGDKSELARRRGSCSGSPRRGGQAFRRQAACSRWWFAEVLRHHRGKAHHSRGRAVRKGLPNVRLERCERSGNEFPAGRDGERSVNHVLSSVNREWALCAACWGRRFRVGPLLGCGRGRGRRSGTASSLKAGIGGPPAGR